MREDYIEQLDKMFPDGYVIAYTCQNKTVRLTLFNPQKYEFIEEIHQTLKELAE